MAQRNRSTVSPHPDARALGVLSGAKLAFGVTYAEFNGVNVVCEIAARERTLWAKPEVLRRLFAYPFEDLGCNRITVTIEESNERSLRVCRHLGFIEEARLQGAASDGGDVIVLRLFKEECRWIEADGQEYQGSRTAEPDGARPGGSPA